MKKLLLILSLAVLLAGCAPAAAEDNSKLVLARLSGMEGYATTLYQFLPNGVVIAETWVDDANPSVREETHKKEEILVPSSVSRELLLEYFRTQEYKTDDVQDYGIYGYYVEFDESRIDIDASANPEIIRKINEIVK